MNKVKVKKFNLFTSHTEVEVYSTKNLVNIYGLSSKKERPPVDNYWSIYRRLRIETQSQTPITIIIYCKKIDLNSLHRRVFHFKRGKIFFLIENGFSNMQMR